MKEQLLLLHGALGSIKQFGFIKESLEESFDVFAINFEGHGGDETSNEFSIQLFTENVIDYIKENSKGETNIFGCSMGGYVALNVALKIPLKIKKSLL